MEDASRDERRTGAKTGCAPGLVSLTPARCVARDALLRTELDDAQTLRPQRQPDVAGDGVPDDEHRRRHVEDAQRDPDVPDEDPIAQLRPPESEKRWEVNLAREARGGQRGDYL